MLVGRGECKNLCLTTKTGVECDGTEKHFLCSADLSDYVQAESKDDMGRLEQRQARIMCPASKHQHGKCQSAAFSDELLAKHITGFALQLYLEARLKVAEKQLSSKLEKEKQEAIEREVKRLAEMDEAARKVERAFHHITPQLLTLRCPRCHSAFLDFNGCCAVQCSFCPCNFCAYCLTDCGTDAHRHVAHCDLNNHPTKDVFNSQENVEAAQRQRKESLVQLYLSTLGPDLRARVIKRCATEFRDLRVNIT